MNENQIRNRLIEHGEFLYKAKHEMVQFTRNEAADRLLNDLEKYPHAFANLVALCAQQWRLESFPGESK